MKPKIVVVGSSNTDLIVQLPHLPVMGETVIGSKFIKALGGKGANQAVAASRLGAEVTFVARLGCDSFGEECLQAYRQEGLDTRFIIQDKQEASGIALIMVGKSGQNMIGIASGANGQLTPADVEAAEDAIAAADCLLLQLEIPLATVQRAAQLARQHSVRVILNPAPAAHLDMDLIKLVDVLTPNEVELNALLGFLTEDSRQLVFETDLAQRVGALLVTLGEKGALLLQGQQRSLIPAFQVCALDTTAAGDAFNGGLAVALARGKPIVEAVRFASAVAALSVTRLGAMPSLPRLAEVEEFLKNQVAA